MDRFWCLQQLDFFNNIPRDMMSVMSESLKDELFKKKELVFSAGDVSNDFFIIKTGKIRIYKLSLSGKELTLNILKPGDLFGEMTLISDEPRTTFAEVFEDCYLCRISKSDFEKYKDAFRDISSKVYKYIGLKRKEIEAKLEDLVFLDVEERFKNLLQHLSARFGKEDVDENIVIELKLTHQDIGNLLGVYRQTASEIINDFEKRKLIDIVQKKIRILHNKIPK